MCIRLLNVCCVHGDEPIGQYIERKFPQGKNQYFMWDTIIANPEALSLKQRFIDADLNRVFPGLQDGNYEERRAYLISKIMSNYDLVLDWHQSKSEVEDILFVRQVNPLIQQVCESFNIKHVVDMERGNGDYEGLLMYQHENAVLVEYGNRYDFEGVVERVNRDITNLLNCCRVESFFEKNYYKVYGKIDLSQKGDLNLRDFHPLKDNEREYLGIYDEDIYPILINGYLEDGIYCKLLQRIVMS